MTTCDLGEAGPGEERGLVRGWWLVVEVVKYILLALLLSCYYYYYIIFFYFGFVFFFILWSDKLKFILCIYVKYMRRETVARRNNNHNWAAW